MESVSTGNLLQIQNIDLNLYDPEPCRALSKIDSRITKNIRALISLYAVCPVFVLSVILLLQGYALGIVGVLMSAMIAMWLMGTAERKSVLAVDGLAAPVRSVYLRLVEQRIANLELTTGGICQLVDKIRPEMLTAYELECFLRVMEQSQQKSNITDIQTYYEILSHCKEVLRQDALELRRESMILEATQALHIC